MATSLPPFLFFRIHCLCSFIVEDVIASRCGEVGFQIISRASPPATAKNETSPSFSAGSHSRNHPQSILPRVHGTCSPLSCWTALEHCGCKDRASPPNSGEKREAARVTLGSAPSRRSHCVSLDNAGLFASRCPESGRTTRRRVSRSSSELHSTRANSLRFKVRARELERLRRYRDH